MQSPPDTASRQFAIAITALEPLAITTTSLPSARRNKNYNRTLTATGRQTPYSWSIVSGSLPPGVSLNTTTGTISGKASALGTWTFTVQAQDSQVPAATASRSLSLTATR